MSVASVLRARQNPVSSGATESGQRGPRFHRRSHAATAPEERRSSDSIKHSPGPSKESAALDPEPVGDSCFRTSPRGRVTVMNSRGEMIEVPVQVAPWKRVSVVDDVEKLRTRLKDRNHRSILPTDRRVQQWDM